MLTPPVFLYAETHFRFFRSMPSLLFKKEPEVVFDAPSRCAPGKDLPVFLLVNDTARFPADVAEVAVTVSQKARPPLLFTFGRPGRFAVQHALDAQAKAFVFPIPRSGLPQGRVFINCKAVLKSGKRVFTVLNDNFFSSSKLPFTCFLANEQYPGSNSFSYGDLHIHSQYSQSQVEFGPPISVIDVMANTCGLDFIAVTDHSYDLACSMENYLKQDKELTRWKSMINDIETGPQKICIVLPGEEVSCFNSNGKSIHLCGLAINDFIPGSADGARHNGLKTLKLTEAIQAIHTQKGLAVAAHPGSRFGIIQRLLLGRGGWQQNDMALDIDAVQAVNNGFGASWIRSKNLWINELLKGRKLPLVAGNDSHGDFNRYRFVSTPFFSVSENFLRHLSYARTGLYMKASSREEVLNEIKRGATFVTNGPFITITYSKSDDNSLISHETISPAGKSLTVKIISTYEFGKPINLTVFFGKYKEKSEHIVFSRNYKEEYEILQDIPLEKLHGKGYIRAEAYCLKEDGIRTYAVTSPCYLDLT